MWKRGKEEDFQEEKFSSCSLKHSSAFVIIKYFSTVSQQCRHSANTAKLHSWILL